MHDSIEQQVYDGLKDGLRDATDVGKILADAIDDIGRPAFIAAALVGAKALVTTLIPLGGAVAAVVDIDLASRLIELLYDMPKDVANQVCNSFAFDCHRGYPGDPHCVDASGKAITDIDSDNWGDAPGEGRTVSPDDIHMFWDAPGPSGPNRELQGIYGYNVPVQLVVGVVRRQRYELVPSTGTATIQGHVRSGGSAVIGAYVKAACVLTTTRESRPGYSLEVRAGGRYKVIARYEDAVTGKVLYGQRDTVKSLDTGEVLDLDIDVIEPPECMRHVTVRGSMYLYDGVLFGAQTTTVAFE